MEDNRILARLERLGARLDPAWLLTMLAVLETERYTLPEWNEALSAALGRRVFCPSYRTLERRVREAALEEL